MLKTLAVPHTGMAAICLDLGDSKDVHPQNKQEVGFCLGLLALPKGIVSVKGVIVMS